MRPKYGLILSTNGPCDSDSHLWRFHIIEANRREGNFNLKNPSFLCNPGLSCVNPVPIPVGTGFIGNQSVILGTKHTDLEHVGIPIIVISVQCDPNVVVLVNPATSLEDIATNEVRLRIIHRHSEI